MMARSKAQQIVGNYLQAERQNQRPGQARPEGLARECGVCFAVLLGS
jgi:hypothetical protein